MSTLSNNTRVRVNANMIGIAAVLSISNIISQESMVTNQSQVFEIVNKFYQSFCVIFDNIPCFRDTSALFVFGFTFFCIQSEILLLMKYGQNQKPIYNETHTKILPSSVPAPAPVGLS